MLLLKCAWVVAHLTSTAVGIALNREAIVEIRGDASDLPSLIEFHSPKVSGRLPADVPPAPILTLSSGYSIPTIGLGTFLVPPGSDTYWSVKRALDLGYRMVDTAEIYENEADVGRAIIDSGIPRSEIFVSTKIWNTAHQWDLALAAAQASNDALGLGYIDLLLIHWPDPGRILETWDALLHLRDVANITRSIGVANFKKEHLELLESHCRPPPELNQFELHPLNYNEQVELIDYCQENNIVVQPYGSVLNSDALTSVATPIAEKHGKSTHQVLLRWALDKGFVVIPKSTNQQHLAQNFDVLDFTLSDADQAALEGVPAQAATKYPLMSAMGHGPFPLGDLGDTSHGSNCQ